MKKTILILTLFLFFSACKKECEFYYEGKKCDTEVRQQYFGTYAGVATIGSNTQNVTATITTSTAGAQYFIIDGQIDCTLTSATSFTIPQQLYYTSQGTMNVEGTGSFNGSQLIYNVILSTGGGTPYVMNFTGSK